MGAMTDDGARFSGRMVNWRHDRRAELEEFEREKCVWRSRALALEEECAELDDAINANLVAGASVGAVAAHRRVDIVSETAVATAEIKASAAQARLEVLSLEKEEALLEAVARERVQSCNLHATNAQMLQERAAAFEASAAREAEASERLASELKALQSRAVLEKRRALQEHRVRDLHLQVAEASTCDAEAAAQDFAADAASEEKEDLSRHEEDLRHWRASCAKRLVCLEAVTASEAEALVANLGSAVSSTTPAISTPEPPRHRSKQGTVRQPQAKQKSGASGAGATAASPPSEASARKPVDEAAAAARNAALYAELKERRALDLRRFAAAREEVTETLQALRDESTRRTELHNVEEFELIVTESEARSSSEAASVANAASAAVACRCARLEQRLRDAAVEDAVALAAAETRAAKVVEWRHRLRRQNGALESCATELEAGVRRAEQAKNARIASLKADVATATSAASAEQAKESSARIAWEAIQSRDTQQTGRQREEALLEERAVVEAICLRAAADAGASHSERLAAERGRRDRAVRALGELRAALRRQHAVAEAAHASSVAEEEQTKFAFMQLRLTT